jgi:hypothetical protein
MERNLSVETIQALNKIVRTCRYLRHAIGREPTPEPQGTWRAVQIHQTLNERPVYAGCRRPCAY